MSWIIPILIAAVIIITALVVRFTKSTTKPVSSSNSTINSTITPTAATTTTPIKKFNWGGWILCGIALIIIIYAVLTTAYILEPKPEKVGTIVPAGGYAVQLSLPSGSYFSSPKANFSFRLDGEPMGSYPHLAQDGRFVVPAGRFLGAIMASRTINIYQR